MLLRSVSGASSRFLGVASRQTMVAATLAPTFGMSSTRTGLAAFALPTRDATFGSVAHVQASTVPFEHRDKPYNKESTPFEFSQENMKEVYETLAKYPTQYARGAIMPLLHLAQKQEGWVSLAAMNKVAKITNVPAMDVYEVATFYTMYFREPVGEHVIGVCNTTPCQLCGSESVYEALSQHLGISYGETTKDGKFTLIELECLGACVNAPMISIGDYYYEDLTPETAVELMKKLEKGESVERGPQGAGARRNCEPAKDRRTLLSDPQPPPLRTDGEL